MSAAEQPGHELNTVRLFRKIRAGGAPTSERAEDYGVWWDGLVSPLLYSYEAGGLHAAARYAESGPVRDALGPLERLYPETTTAPPTHTCPALPADATAIYQHLAPCAEWLGDYMRFASAAAPMGPPSFHEVAGLFAASVAIARRLCIRVGTDAIYPNIYVLFVAPSTLYSKTTSFKVLRRLFRQSGLLHLFVPQSMTPESLMQELGTHIPDWVGRADEQARAGWLEERAYAAQRGWLLDEASRLLNGLKRDYNNGLIESLLDLYECPETSTSQTTGRGRMTVTDAYLGFFGATTPEAAGPHISNTELWFNGFWARFVLVQPDAPPTFEFFPAPMDVPQSLSDGLARIHRLFPVPSARMVEVQDASGPQRPVVVVDGVALPEHVRLADGVFESWKSYTYAVRFSMLSDGKIDATLTASYGRLGTQLIKVAMLLATMDCQTLPVVVELRHLARAQQIVERWRAALHSMLHEGTATDEARLSDRALERLAKGGSQGMTARDLYRELKVKSEDMRSILEELVLAGKVAREVGKGKNGQTVELWRLIR